MQMCVVLWKRGFCRMCTSRTRTNDISKGAQTRHSPLVKARMNCLVGRTTWHARARRIAKRCHQSYGRFDCVSGGCGPLLYVHIFRNLLIVGIRRRRMSDHQSFIRFITQRQPCAAGAVWRWLIDRQKAQFTSTHNAFERLAASNGANF